MYQNQRCDVMKKKIVIIVSVIVLFVLLIFNFSTVIFIGNENVTAKYIYSDKNIITDLTAEDSKLVTEILNGKHISIFELPACGFDENVSVIINDNTFCIACDECGTVYFKDGKCIAKLEKDGTIDDWGYYYKDGDYIYLQANIDKEESNAFVREFKVNGNKLEFIE